MGKSTAASNAFLALLYNATTWNLIAENDSTSPATNLYVALHTAAVSVGGDQTEDEATYTGYARLAIVRTSSGWEVPSGGETSNAALAQFDACSGGSNVITHVSIGLAASGASQILHSGALNASRTISDGIQPQFAANALVVTET